MGQLGDSRQSTVAALRHAPGRAGLRLSRPRRVRSPVRRAPRLGPM